MDNLILESHYKILCYMTSGEWLEKKEIETKFGLININQMIQSGLIEKKNETICGQKDTYYEVTSKGRIEMNIYRNKDRKPEKKERKGCPRCGDKDDSYQICCGYHITKEGKS